MKTKEKQKNRTSLNEMFYNKKTQRLEKIDNRLVRKERRLENVNNKTKIQFNDLTQEDDLLVLQEDECKLSMKLLGKKEKEQTKFAARHVKQLHDKKVLYEDAFEDSDVEYEILEDKRIKENIVIKNNNKETYEYQYLLTLENLTLKQEQNTKTLQFVNKKGKALFAMVEPVMFDSNNSSSNDIDYEVKHLEDNKYLLTLKADENWVNNKERVLPIYLDPTLQLLAASFAKWYLIEKYKSITEMPNTGGFEVAVNRNYIAVMEFDEEELNEMIRGGEITAIDFWLGVSSLDENVKLIATTKTLEEIKANGIPSLYENETENVLFSASGSNVVSGTFYKTSLIEHYSEGRKRYIVTKDYNTSATYAIKLSINPHLCDYHIGYNFEHKVDVEVDKEIYLNNTKLNEKLVISKCLLTKEFRINVLDLAQLNIINLSHTYSTCSYLSQTIKTSLFSQYGESFRLNYSYLLYDGRDYHLDSNNNSYRKGNFILIDSNDNIVKYHYDNGEGLCENDPKQILTISGEKIIISSPTSKMTFVKTALVDFYLLSSIEDLIYGQFINISYNNDKVTISSIVDEKNNRLDFHYNENGLLSSIDKNNNEYMLLGYEGNKLVTIEFNDYDNRSIEFGYEDNNEIIITDSYEDVYYSIINSNNQLIIKDLNTCKTIKKIDIFNYYTSITNRYGEKQILVLEDNKICSSYILKSTATNDNVVLYSNVNYNSFSESEVEEENGTATITTIMESGSLNINNNNLVTDSHFNTERYDCDLFNGKNVFYLIDSDSSTNIIECTLNDAQLSKGTFYTFGIFLKSLTSNISNTTVKITLLNGSNELASKTFDKIKPVWDFKFISFKYYEQDENITNLKIRIEISNNNNDILFANPILRNDASYTYMQSVSSYDEEEGEYKTIKQTVFNGFSINEQYDDKLLLECSNTIDLHNGDIISYEAFSYHPTTFQLKSKNHFSFSKLLNKNSIENIFESNKVIKTNIYSSKGESLVIQNKYSFDSFGNSNPTYDERDALIETCVYNNDGTIDSTSKPDLAAILCDYDNGVLTKLSTSSNSYFVNFNYDDGLIAEIDLNDKTTYSYDYDYDYENMINTVKVNGTLYSYNKLERENNKISVIEKIGPHFEKKYVYNLEAKLTAIYENDVLKTSFADNAYGQTETFREIIDDDTSIIKTYHYFDDDKENVKTINYNGLYNFSVTNEKYNYTDCSQNSSIVLGGVTYSYKYTYNNNLEKMLTKINYPNTTHTIDYNGFGNIEKQITTKGSLSITNTYVYQSVTSVDDKIRTSNYVESVSQVTKYNEEEKSNSFISHSYNPNGTIAFMNIGGETYSYTYDLFGRLKKEISSYSGITKEYTYDNNGNVTYITETDASNQVKVTQQSFNNVNKLQSINYQDGSFVEITYDEIGNPILISKNGLCESGTGFETENIALTYEKGNRLSTYGNNISFKYDLSGIRISKLVGNELHKYYIHNGNILREEVINSVTGGSIYTLDFYYDETGVCSFKHNNAMYYYQKDLTGSIIGVYNDFGNIVAKYRYDAWGNHKVYDQLNQEESLNTFIGNINPFRFKSYYFDRETNLYYCKSRYFNPQWRRWLTCDRVEYLEPSSFCGLNLYCYCMNNPIMYCDPSGYMPKWLSTTLKIVAGVVIIAGCVVGSIYTGGALSVLLAGAAIGAAAGGIGAGISTAVSGGDIHDFANAFLMSTSTGAISGAFAASQFGVFAQMGVNALLGAANYAGTQGLSGDKITLGGLIVNAGIGAVCGLIGKGGWMQDIPAALFAGTSVKNALKYVGILAGKEALLRMTLPSFFIGGIGGGIYGRISKYYNPFGDFIGI